MLANIGTCLHQVQSPPILLMSAVQVIKSHFRNSWIQRVITTKIESSLPCAIIDISFIIHENPSIIFSRYFTNRQITHMHASKKHILKIMNFVVKCQVLFKLSTKTADILFHIMYIYL